MTSNNTWHNSPVSKCIMSWSSSLYRLRDYVTTPGHAAPHAVALCVCDHFTKHRRSIYKIYLCSSFFEVHAGSCPLSCAKHLPRGCACVNGTLSSRGHTDIPASTAATGGETAVIRTPLLHAGRMHLFSMVSAGDTSLDHMAQD